MKTKPLMVLLAGMLALGAAYAQSGPETSENNLPSAEEVIRRANERNTAQCSQQTIHMKLSDKNGSTRERVTRGFGKSFGDEKHFLMFFLDPSNIRGTALLTYDYGDPKKNDDQWLYLPAMRKTRRISSAERGGSFLGTDFTFEDIKNQSRASLADRTWKTLGKKPVDGHMCYEIEATPVTPALVKEFGYSKVVSYVDEDLQLLRRSDFWDASSTQFKSVSIRDFQQIKGIWTAGTLEAKNLKTGHSTLFTVTDVDYDTNLPDDLFTVQTLERGLPNIPSKP